MTKTATKKIRVSDLPDFDLAEHLRNEEDIAAYLTLVIAENDAAELASALGDVARARNDRSCQGVRHYP